jgi:hypothetical protein
MLSRLVLVWATCGARTLWIRGAGSNDESFKSQTPGLGLFLRTYQAAQP